MHSYVGFLSGRLRVEPIKPIHPVGDRTKHRPASYADQQKYSRLRPENIPQPEGQIITDQDWEQIV